jgi:AcrR family transcriptional regulator
LTSEEIRQAVYEEAKACFLSEGIAATEMKKIAADIGIGRSTLYRYFPSKELLAVLVAAEMIDGLLFTDLLPGVDPALDGYGKTRAFFGLYIERLWERPDVLRFFLEYDSLLSRGNADFPARDIFEKRIFADIEGIAAFVREGQADLSLRPDVDPVAFTIMLINSAVGLAQRFLTHTTGEGERYGLDISALLKLQTDLILRAVKA